MLKTGFSGINKTLTLVLLKEKFFDTISIANYRKLLPIIPWSMFQVTRDQDPVLKFWRDIFKISLKRS